MSKRARKKLMRYFSLFMALNILAEVVSPSVAFALTNGTLQPEFTGFEPANSSEMVDLFSGDFKYNIPLMDVDGYPLNLSYHAGPAMDQEASWVGLGWSLNPGVLNRNVRGLPDDFKGEVINSKTNIRPNLSMGVGFHASTWFNADFTFKNAMVGAKVGMGMSVGAALNYNNYKGYGLEVDMDGHLSLTGQMGPASRTIGGGVGMSLNSQDGGTLSQNYSNGVGVNFGGFGRSVSQFNGQSINTRTGAETKSFGSSVNYSGKIGSTNVSIGFSSSSSIPAGPVAYSPKIANDFNSFGFCASFKAGLWVSLRTYLNAVHLAYIDIDGGLMLGYKGNYSSNKLVSQTKSLNSYGYMYSESAKYNSLMDYNSFREGMIYQETPNINFSSHTYDIFSASAQGMGSNFRTFRSDVGVLHDPNGSMKGINKNAQAELSFGTFVHTMAEAGKTSSSSKSGNWDTQLLTSIPFVNLDINNSNNRFYEKYYFKEMGAINGREGEAAIGGEAPISPMLQKNGPDFNAMSPIATPFRSKRDIRNTYIQALTANEAVQYGVEQNYSLYTSGTASIDPVTRLVAPTATVMSRLTKGSTNISHHLSEVTMTNPSGDRYTYGIPVYNLEKKKVMFNASERVYDDYSLNDWWPVQPYANTALPVSNKYQFVTYDADGGSTEIDDNRRGLDNFYQHDVTPMYATSYLLTSIVSQDYVDVTGDGPTYDDLGNFTKFNYFKGEDYGWREPFCFPGDDNTSVPASWSNTNIPYSKNQANYEKGLIADEFDDKGFYEWGKRETYYAHSIETKNYVAYFETSTRWDAKGVTSEHGDFASKTSLQLDAIKLYSKSALAANNGDITGIAPIKTVRFEYTYTLCPGTFNSEYDASENPDRGKLTLSRVYFTYGSSEKSALSPYEFNYDAAFNYPYDPRAVDRWGSYKLQTTIAAVGSTLNTLNNVEFPYSEQDKTLADEYAAAWCLTQIKTPSGSKINITYESDDYGYVQNEQVGQMLNLKMVKDYVSPADDASTYSGDPNIRDANYIVIDLESLHDRGISVSTYSTLGMANAFAKKNLIKPNKQLYYKTFMKLGGKENSIGLKKDFWEFVSGYAEMEELGVYTSTISGNTYTETVNSSTQTYYKYLYVKLKKEIAFKSQDVFPITIAGWDFMRNFLPRVAYPGSEPANMGDGSHKPLKQFKNMLVGLGVALADFVNGVSGSPNKRFFKHNFCTKINYTKSFVRAYVPLKRKMGGGHRVKKIVTDDSWDVMTGAEAKSTYGQVYDYTTTEGNLTISSGVAAYEPLVGGDEISLRQPINFEIEKRFAPNDHLYQETPYAEPLYPSPQVGYGKVTITPLPDPGVQEDAGYCKIGKTEYEFYTAKNFPVVYLTTGLDKKPNETSLLEEFITIKKSFKMLAASQGHVVKLNDMHGKLKSIAAYAEDNLLAPISKITYYYKQANPSINATTQLITSVPAINEMNQISTMQMSRDVDLSVDVKESYSESETFGDKFLLEVGMKLYIWVFPCPLPSFCMFTTTLPYVKTASKDLITGAQKFGVNTTTMTKIVQQYGILSKVESFDNKTKTTIDNLLWDKNTGEVLLTKETNHLDQSVYNFNYPAYWPYPQMGQEFKRDNIQILCPTVTVDPIWDGTTGVLTPSNIGVPNLIKHGDEVRIYEVNSSGTPTALISNPADNDNRFWSIANYTNTVDEMFLLDKNGVVVNSTSYPSIDTDNNDYMIKIVKPINKNNTSAKAGYVTSKLSPMKPTSVSVSSTLNIVDAGVQEFCSGNSIYMNNTVTNQSLTTAAPNYSSTSFNEIITGYYGTYRPSSTYKYNVDRKYSSVQPQITSDGYYLEFAPYWNYFTKWHASNDGHWMKLNNNKYYSPHGNLIESENANLISTSQRQAFNHTLPALTAYNAKGDEVGFDSFEDYTVYTALVTNSTNVQNNDYLGMYKALSAATGSPPALTGTATPVSHTGRYSLQFAPSKTLTIQGDYMKSLQAPPYDVYEWNNCTPYIMDCSKLNYKAKKYLISMWVKGSTAASSYTNLINCHVKEIHSVNSVVTSNTQTLIPVYSSPIINGWQKIDFEVTLNYSLPLLHDYSLVELNIFSGNSSTFYMDDMRIQPAAANMICNVYDPLSLRLWAQLDDRNYATLLEYDSEGMLVRKKKETEKGIYTIQETRKGIVK